MPHVDALNAHFRRRVGHLRGNVIVLDGLHPGANRLAADLDRCSDHASGSGRRGRKLEDRRLLLADPGELDCDGLGRNGPSVGDAQGDLRGRDRVVGDQAHGDRRGVGAGKDLVFLRKVDGNRGGRSARAARVRRTNGRPSGSGPASPGSLRRLRESRKQTLPSAFRSFRRNRRPARRSRPQS